MIVGMDVPVAAGTVAASRAAVPAGVAIAPAVPVPPAVSVPATIAMTITGDGIACGKKVLCIECYRQRGQEGHDGRRCGKFNDCLRNHVLFSLEAGRTGPGGIAVVRPIVDRPVRGNRQRHEICICMWEQRMGLCSYSVAILAQWDRKVADATD